MDERYGARYYPTPRATRLDRTTLQTLLGRYQGELSNLRAEERGTVKLNKAERAYLWGKQEMVKAHIRAIRAQLEAGL
jgi:hypothetical protein